MHGFATNTPKCITRRSPKRFCKEKIFPDIMEFRDPKSGEIVTEYMKKPNKYSSFTNRNGNKIFIKRGNVKKIELEAKVSEYFSRIKSIKTLGLFEVKDSPFGYELRMSHFSCKDLESLIIPFLGKPLPGYIREHLKEYVLQIAKVHAYGPISFLNVDNNLVSEEDYYNRLSNRVNKTYNTHKKEFDKILTCYKAIANKLGNSKIKTFVKDARLKNALSSVFKQKKEPSYLLSEWRKNVVNTLRSAVFSYISVMNNEGRKAILEDKRLRNTLFLFLSVLNNRSKRAYLPVDKKLKKPVSLDLSVLKDKIDTAYLRTDKLTTAISFCLQVLKEYKNHQFNKNYISLDGRYILEKCNASLIDFDPKHLRLAPPQHDLSKILLFSVGDRKKFLDEYIKTYNSEVKVYNSQYSQYGIKQEIKDKEEFEFVFLNSVVDYALFCTVEKKYKPSSNFHKHQIRNAVYVIDELKHDWKCRYTKKDLEQLDYIKTFLSKGI